MSSPSGRDFIERWLLRHDVQVNDWAAATTPRPADPLQALVMALDARVGKAPSSQPDFVARLKPAVIVEWRSVLDGLVDLHGLRTELRSLAERIELTLRDAGVDGVGVDYVVENTLFHLVRATRDSLAFRHRGGRLTPWIHECLRLEIKRRATERWNQRSTTPQVQKKKAALLLDVFREAVDGAKLSKAPRAPNAGALGVDEASATSGATLIADLLGYVRRESPGIELLLLSPQCRTIADATDRLKDIATIAAEHTLEKDAAGGDGNRDRARSYLVQLLLAEGVKLPWTAVTPTRNINSITEEDAICLWLAWQRSKSLEEVSGLWRLWEVLPPAPHLVPKAIVNRLRPTQDDGAENYYVNATAVVRMLCSREKLGGANPVRDAHQELARLLPRLLDGPSLVWSDLKCIGVFPRQGSTADSVLRDLLKEANQTVTVRELLTWVVAICVDEEPPERALKRKPNSVEVHLSRARLQFADKVLARMFGVIDGVVWC